MKNSIYILFIAVFAFSCSPQEKSAQTENTEGDKALRMAGAGASADTAVYALSLDIAAELTRSYRDYQANLGLQYPVSNAFTIRAVTLMQAMGLPVTEDAKFKNIRAYIGMDANHQYRLILTPVDGADCGMDEPGVDIILEGDFTEGGEKTDSIQNGKYVLDFTCPCPNSCPPNSPLNTD